MSDIVKIDELAAELASALTTYSQDVADAIKDIADEEAEKAVETLKSTSPRKTGKYAKGWSKKTSYQSTSTKRNTVYNKTRYQITHLLEFGHASRNGGRVRAIAHIAPVEQEIIKDFESKIEKVVSGH